MATFLESIKKVLVDEFSVSRIDKFYWVNSTVTLCWIRNEKPFERNRVNKIRRLSSKESWLFCPGSLNPADIPSRAKYGPSLSLDSLWWEGPKFLQYL